MASAELRIVDGKEAGAWIKAELTGEWGSVTGVVPDRFDGYARIFHPALDSERNPVTWAEVAAETGREIHPLVQWESLVDSKSYMGEPTLWAGSPPETGGLAEPLLASLVELLTGNTNDPESCLFGVWEGWGGVEADLQSAFVREDRKAPRLRLPDRPYIVLAGPLSAAPMISNASGFEPQLIWPADRAWCLASEIDFDSTLVGGSRQLVDEIVSAQRFEALEIGPRDLLTMDADRVNPPAPWRSDS